MEPVTACLRQGKLSDQRMALNSVYSAGRRSLPGGERYVRPLCSYGHSAGLAAKGTGKVRWF